MSVLALAGGVNSALRHPRVRLQRNGQVYETRVESILAEPSMNIRVQGGDQIAIVEDARKKLTTLLSKELFFEFKMSLELIGLLPAINFRQKLQ